MTLLAGPGVTSDRAGRWLIAGVAFSLSFHVLAVVAWWWQPGREPPPLPPAAVPMVVSVVGAVSSPEPRPMEEVGPPQPEVSASAPPPPAAEPEPVSKVSAPAPEIDRPALLQVSEKRSRPKPERRKVIEDARSEAEPSPAQESRPDSQSDRAQSSQRALAAPSVNARRSDSLTAPRQGQTSVQERAARVSWQQELHAHLERHKRYPRQARRKGKEGRPRVSFTMDRDGKVLSVSLVSSSGTPALDREAMALVQRAVPLPRPPASISGAQITLTVPINFSL